MLVKAAVCAASLLSVQAFAAQPPTQPGAIYGSGLLTCNAWLNNPDDLDPGNRWILGFWSGVNVSYSARIGLGLGDHGIETAVETVCRPNMSMQLYEAGINAWVKVKNERTGLNRP